MIDVLDKLKIDYPIIQAPMAGSTTPTLVSAVSDAGGLGNIGAGYLSAAETRNFIQEVKGLTNKPFGINLFVPEQYAVTESEIKQAQKLLDFCTKDLQLEETEVPELEMADEFEEQVQVIIEEKVAVCSFTFGIPSQAMIQRLQDNGVFVIGTATTVREAQMIEVAGMDAIVVQGSEAGGHRGTFLGEESFIGLMSLIPQVVDLVTIPVIAAGGMMDGRGVMAAHCLGAEAAQLGTAFLTTTESGANPLHKESILQATEEDLQVTRAFSGKSARGIRNNFMKAMEGHEADIVAYPVQNTLTKGIRREAAKQGNKEFMSLWSGQSPRLSRNLSVKELMDDIVKECRKVNENTHKRGL